MAFVDGPILNSRRVATLAQMRAYLARENARVAKAKGIAPLPQAEIDHIAGVYQRIGDVEGVAGDGALAQAMHETAAWTFGNQVPASARNPAGIGAINDGTSYLSFPNWGRGIEAHITHILAWAGDPRGAASPRIAAVRQEAARKGYAKSWRDLGGRWAVREGIPWQEQARMPGNYGEGIERHWQGIRAEQGGNMAAGAAATSRMIAELRARGVEVIDRRGKYGNYPARNTGKYIGVHWSGDPVGRIVSPGNTLDQDLYRTERYRAYHMEEGHGWPGIAYAVLCYPSGRVIVCHDLDRLTYHAFDANDDAPAVCCPLSDGAQPSAAQVRSFHHVLDWMCFDCPELAAGQAQVFGHNELTFLDARNGDTRCPGTLAPHVKAYRARGKRMYETGDQPKPQPQHPAGFLDPVTLTIAPDPPGQGVIVEYRVEMKVRNGEKVYDYNERLRPDGVKEINRWQEVSP
jgi:hypothetical protein